MGRLSQRGSQVIVYKLLVRAKVNEILDKEASEYYIVKSQLH